MKARAACAFLLAISFCILPFAPIARGESVEDLCRLHGVESRENIVRIREAYPAARKAGIGEEELHPFLEDILRRKLDCAQMVRVLSAATKLREEGLPHFVVFRKVQEGVAKEAAPALVVEAAESKVRTLYESRDVLKSLEADGYRILDYSNAVVVVSSYIEKGYSPGDIVSQIRRKGIQGGGFAGLSGVLERNDERKDR